MRPNQIRLKWREKKDSIKGQIRLLILALAASVPSDVFPRGLTSSCRTRLHAVNEQTHMSHMSLLSRHPTVRFLTAAAQLSVNPVTTRSASSLEFCPPYTGGLNCSMKVLSYYDLHSDRGCRSLSPHLLRVNQSGSTKTMWRVWKWHNPETLLQRPLLN